MEKGNQGRTKESQNTNEASTNINKLVRDLSEIDMQEGNLQHGRKGGNFDEEENLSKHETNESRKSE